MTTGLRTATAEIEDHFAALEQAAARARTGTAGLVVEWAELLASCFARGGKVLICGNGGSAAEAMHLSGELLGRFRGERRPLPAIALCSDPAALTAIANDYGIEHLFARQVLAHGARGDVLIAVSTSGASPNVLAAVRTALELGLEVCALTGPAPNPLAGLSRSVIAVDAPTTATVQEIHLSVVHTLCLALDQVLEERVREERVREERVLEARPGESPGESAGESDDGAGR